MSEPLIQLSTVKLTEQRDDLGVAALAIEKAYSGLELKSTDELKTILLEAQNKIQKVKAEMRRAIECASEAARETVQP